MSEPEPDDSRDVTNTAHRAPGEPPRTGPREDEARARTQQEEQGEAPGKERALEGDSAAHPDRFGGTAQQGVGQEEQSQPEQAQQGDRWKEAAEREEYVPEGK